MLVSRKKCENKMRNVGGDDYEYIKIFSAHNHCGENISRADRWRWWWVGQRGIDFDMWNARIDAENGEDSREEENEL